jgi:pimeloyl-ACP methyl ester carboxylesterase
MAAPRAAAGGARTIVFTHANGFPAGTYETLFEAWRAAGWRVLAHEKFGHDPRYPIASGWSRLRDELLDFVAREAGAGPVALVGHSFGGILSLLAASKKPALASAVVLLDSPVVAGWRAHGFRMLKATGLIQRGGPGKVSARRRTTWPSAEALREHFERKHVFQLWDRRVLDDYLRAGFERAADGGMTLAFDREVETRIYGTLPHHVPELLRRHPLRCPVAFIGGTRSVENRQLGLAYVHRLAGPRWRWIEGTHLFPMEKPAETAAAVVELLSAGAPAAPTRRAGPPG